VNLKILLFVKREREGERKAGERTVEERKYEK
jgi:hypothetical protein